MKYIFFILVFILILIYKKNQYSNISYWRKLNNEKTKKILNKFEDLYENYLYDIDGLFLTAGTLLGCVRENNIIVFDDDIDLGIVVNNNLEILNIKNKIKKRFINSKYEVNDIFFGLQICDRYTKQFYLDIFFYSKYKNKIHYCNLKARLMWPSDYYLENEVNTFKKGIFNNKLYNIPIGYNVFLKRAYGNDCLRVSKYKGFHIDFNSNIIQIFNTCLIRILMILNLNHIKNLD